MKIINEKIEDVSDQKKKVLLRLDLNVPLKNKIIDDYKNR